MNFDAVYLYKFVGVLQIGSDYLFKIRMVDIKVNVPQIDRTCILECVYNKRI